MVGFFSRRGLALVFPWTWTPKTETNETKNDAALRLVFPPPSCQKRIRHMTILFFFFFLGLGFFFFFFGEGGGGGFGAFGFLIVAPTLLVDCVI